MLVKSIVPLGFSQGLLLEPSLLVFKLGLVRVGAILKFIAFWTLDRPNRSTVSITISLKSMPS